MNGEGEVRDETRLDGAPDDNGAWQPGHLVAADAARQTAERHRASKRWRALFRASTVVGIVVLGALLYNIADGSMGFVAYEHKVDPATVVTDGREIEALTSGELVEVLRAELSKGAFATLERDGPLAGRDHAELLGLVGERVLQTRAVATWTLTESLTRRREIEATVADRYPDAELRFNTWINRSFVTAPQSSRAEYAGIRTAIFGSLWVILITMAVAVPVGVGAGIYLEEYADPTRRVNRIIQTNINNLAGVPSIIYGMLGLAVFVRALSPLTSGAVFGYVDPTTANGRTIVSAGLTMALLILPLIIINAQEAIRAVPLSLRQASFGLGATKWQTIWHHVLPGALPGILTGTILAMSRAIGETAPLLVVGVSTFITFDPGTPFDKYTTLPAQIYQWTARPQPEFHNVAAAASLVLLVLLVLLNATAIHSRNRTKART